MLNAGAATLRAPAAGRRTIGTQGRTTGARRITGITVLIDPEDFKLFTFRPIRPLGGCAHD